MKQLILIGFFVLLLVGLSSATSITVNSLNYSTLNRGDTIVASVTVNNPNVYQDLRDVTLNWVQSNNANAWTECNSQWNSITQTTWDWLCILTVTPQMNMTSDVNIRAVTRSGNDAGVLLGNFAFKGTPFPVPTTRYGPVKCITTQGSCAIYEKIGDLICNSYNRNGTCRSHRTVWHNTNNCLRYSSKITCSNR